MSEQLQMVYKLVQLEQLDRLCKKNYQFVMSFKHCSFYSRTLKNSSNYVTPVVPVVPVYRPFVAVPIYYSAVWY
ncbi:hypothetical protein BpHYR1_045195 [Brachionus plicatilis]|uniref:Uncharacterized protein n=1 Tax=Brachionus plicatilis TaxID=10195 RepID=A0A3M7R5B1_BRAPC|nr:hypothetical protein BpHYR1_045195 [Brachionus plicatilis]